MRRWLTILLLVMMPLQLGWAAAGSYCQHESGTQPKHFGHHFHQHKSDAGRDGKGEPDGAGKLHPDCDSCVASVVALPLADDQLPDLMAALPATELNTRPLSRPSSPPDRPDWFCLV